MRRKPHASDGAYALELQANEHAEIAIAWADLLEKLIESHQETAAVNHADDPNKAPGINMAMFFDLFAEGEAAKADRLLWMPQEPSPEKFNAMVGFLYRFWAYGEDLHYWWVRHQAGLTIQDTIQGILARRETGAT